MKAMTNKRINNLREEINFLRSEVVYLKNSGSEKDQGREFAISLRKITEQIETAIGFNPTEREQRLLDWAFGNWKMANDKFK